MRGFLRRRAKVLAAGGVAASAAVVAIVAGGGGAGCVGTNVTTATFASAFSSAVVGDTLCLASGDYGTFAGALKSGTATQRVTIKEQDGATASITPQFTAASNITIDGLSMGNTNIEGASTKNLTFKNSVWDDTAIAIHGAGTSINNANILFDNNQHLNRMVCNPTCSGFLSRFQFAERSETQPNGVTIQNSTFSGGNADAIQNGGNGTVIQDNYFTNLNQTSGDPQHTDSIHLYGSKNTIVRRNFFYDVAIGIGMYDGGAGELIEDNVIVQDSSGTWAMEFLSDTGSTIRHNTLSHKRVDGATTCGGVACGGILMGHKSGQANTTNLTFQDNILAQIGVQTTAPGFAVESHNLFTTSNYGGSNDVLGTPTYVGGSGPPSTYAGFKLASGSTGAGNASDGLNRGARVP